MTVPGPGPAEAGSYSDWLANVRSLLAYHRPDIQPSLLDPNSTFQAFQAGMAPKAFVLQPVLLLRAIPTPSVAPSATNAARQNGQAVGTTPDSTLVGWMWGLSGLYVGLLAIMGTSAGVLDLPAFVIAIVLVARRGPGAAHGWVKLSLEVFGCIWILSASRGGY